MNNKWAYSYQEGDGKNKQLLGGKGANLCEITQIGLNVPPGFVISTDACLNYLAQPEHQLPEGVMAQTREQMTMLEPLLANVLAVALTPCWFQYVPAPPCQCPA